MRNTLILILSAATTLNIWPAYAGSLREEIKPPANMADAIAKLADEDFHVRESASRWLWSAGKAAESSLHEALKSRDAEVVWRAQNILENFRFGILPDTPPDVAELLAHYRDADASGRNALLESLQNPPPVDQLRALLTLGDLETDKSLKDAIESRIAQIPPEGVMKLIAGNEPGLAEQVLTRSALAGDENAMQHLGALLLMTGGVAKQIESLQSGRGTSPEKRKLLAFLHKLSGRVPVEISRADEDPDIAEQAMLDQHNWRALADLIPRQLEQNDEYLERLAVLAISQRQSGRHQDAQHTINLIRQCANDAADEDYVRRCARALIANDRTRDAVEVLVEKEVLDDAFKLLCAQSRYDDAFALIERVSTPSPLMARLKIAMAGTLLELGEKQQALMCLDEAAQIMRERPRFEILLLLVKTEREIGRPDLALEHSLAAIKLNPGASADETLQELFDAAEPKAKERRVSLAVRWWSQLQHKYDDDAEKRLRMVKNIVDRTVALEEFETLATECIQTSEQNSSANNSDDEGICLALLADTWLAFGRHEKAQEYFERAVRSRRNVEPALMGLGNLASEKKQWVRAAEFFRQAWEHDSTNAAALYLRGWALAQSGQERSGKMCMERACILPLSDEIRRKNLGEVLKRLNHTKAARQQDEMMAQIAGGRSEAAANLLKTLCENLISSGDHRQAADVIQRRLVYSLISHNPVASAPDILSEAFRIHQWRAAAAVRSGELDSATSELRICLELKSPDVELAAAMVPAYQQRGLNREARELLEHAIAAEQRVLERNPASAAHQSNLSKLQRLAGDLTASK